MTDAEERAAVDQVRRLAARIVLVVHGEGPALNAAVMLTAMGLAAERLLSGTDAPRDEAVALFAEAMNAQRRYEA